MRTEILIMLMIINSTALAGPLTKNWGLYNAQWSSHVDAPRAWKLARGGRVVKVCVVDTGIDVTHPDLKDRICPNTGEYGWDFVADRKNPIDVNGHGTHVAGIIRAVSPTACLIPVKYFKDANSGSENLSNLVRSIRYCISRGAEIINYSGGGSEFSPDELEAVKETNEKSILFVTSAGNESWSLDTFTYYPASYDLPNILSVAATTITGQLWSMSDWGVERVRVAAPGENIYSTVPGGGYGYFSGTSQAAPFVAGIAAMILSKYPGLMPKEVIRVISESVDRKPSLKGKVSSGGKVNAYRALLAAKKMTLRSKVSLIK
jgi:thermitase